MIKGKGRMDMDLSGVVLSKNEIRDLVFRLPPVELVQLADEIEDRAKTLEMMSVAETGLAEWNDPGEDIYWPSELPCIKIFTAKTEDQFATCSELKNLIREISKGIGV